MGYIDLNKYYIEEHVFKGNLLFPYFLATTVPHILGARMEEMQNEKIKYGYDQYFEHFEETAPDNGLGQTITADFHFAIAVDKNFKHDEGMKNETKWMIMKLFSNKKFVSEIESIRMIYEGIPRKNLEMRVKGVLKQEALIGSSLQELLNQNNISYKDACLSNLIFQRTQPMMRKYEIPNEYFYVIYAACASGIDYAINHLDEHFNLTYFNYYGGVVYLIRGCGVEVNYLQTLITSPPTAVRQKRMAIITTYFQDCFSAKRPKPKKSEKYKRFLELHELDNKRTDLNDTEKGKIIFGDSGQDKATNIRQLRREMKKELEK